MAVKLNYFVRDISLELYPDKLSEHLNLVPGDDLLSHGEAPHYHRRYVVSLLSSGWDQVVPTFYGRQANHV